MSLIHKLRVLLPASELKNLIYLFLGMLVAGLAEAFGIGVILPFISVVNKPELLNGYPVVVNFFMELGVMGPNAIIIVLAIGVLLLMCAKNFYLFCFMRFQLRFIHHNSAKFSVELLNKYLHADYLYHLHTNTAELLRNIKTEGPYIFTGLLTPLCNLVTETILVIFVLGLLLTVEPLSTFLGIVIIGGAATLFYAFIKKKNKLYGELRVVDEGETYKWINQGLGGIKEVKLSGREDFFVHNCKTHYLKLADVTVFQYLISQAPRLFLETLMVVTVMLIIIVLILQDSSRSNILPTLALFCAAAFRLMPASNRILGAVISLKFAIPALDVIYNNVMELDSTYNKGKEKEGGRKITLEESLSIEKLSFRYPGAENNALENVTFTIPKNKSVGIMGASGSGKSTLLNILLGLLPPTKGSIFIDEINMEENIRDWQRMIGFVPQDIYLTDDSVKRNVAYGLRDHEIDLEQVWKALELAQLDQYVKNLPEGLDTFVGERGIRMSGGQKQRIGIARALYNNPDVLIFDEATSALDTETEREITNSIEKLAHKKTIIIVAHRLSTIQKCDIVYKLDTGIIETVVL